MKLRSTLLFAAASLTASALAPVVATTSAFFAASAVHAQAEDLFITMEDFVKDATFGEGVSKSALYGNDTVYTFTEAGAITGIENTALAEVVTGGTGFVTVAAWVKTANTNQNSVFSFGGQSDGVKFAFKDGGMQITTKGVKDTSTSLGGISSTDWTLVAWTLNLSGAGNSRVFVGTGANNYNTVQAGGWNDPNPLTFAIGSGNSNGLRDAYIGEIANLIIFTSDELPANNSSILAKLGEMPEMTVPTLLWAGTAESNTWDTTSEIWKKDDAPAKFTAGDIVIFGAEAESKEVVIDGDVISNGVSIDGEYTFSGEGTVEVASGGLTFGENGSLTLNSGVSLDLSSTSTAGSTYAEIGGQGTVKLALTQAWANTVSIGTENSFSGTATIASGLFTITNSNIGTGTYNLESGANFQTGGSAAVTNNIVFNGSHEFHANTNHTLELSGKVTGTGGSSVTKKAPGTVKFSGGVDLATFTASAGTTEFSGTGTNTIATLNVTGGTTNISGTGTNTIGNIRQTGGTININEKTSATQFVGTSTWVTAGTLNIGSSGVLTITGNSNSTGGNEGSFQLAHWNGTQTVNVEGVLNLQNAAISSKDGNGDISVKAGGEINFNAGFTIHDAGGNEGVIRVHLEEGGRINVGTGGITDSNVLTLNLNGGTIGSLTDSWSSARALTLGGAVTIDTTKMTFNASGKATATSNESSIELSGVLSGTGALTKAGVGTVTLSGANTYTGGTTISEGSVVAGNASALGTGSLVLSAGATLDVQSQGVTLENVAHTISGNVVLAEKALITNNGTLTVENSATFDISALSPTDSVYTIIGGSGSVSGWQSLTRSNFIQDGHTLGRGTLNVETSGKVTFAVDSLALTWNGTGDSAVWDLSETNWKNESTDTQFYNKDEVTFVKSDDVTKKVVISGNLLATKITVNDSYKFSAASSGAAIVSVSSPGSLVFADEGTLTLGDGVILDLGTVAIDGAVSFDKTLLGTGTVRIVTPEDSHKFDVKLGSFSGTLDVTGCLNWTRFSLGENITIQLSGTSGTTPSLFGGSFKDIKNNIELKTDYKFFSGTNGVTFSGNISGAGKTLTLQGSNATSSITFSGKSVEIGTLALSGTTKFVVDSGTTFSVENGYRNYGSAQDFTVKSDGLLKFSGDILFSSTFAHLFSGGGTIQAAGFVLGNGNTKVTLSGGITLSLGSEGIGANSNLDNSSKIIIEDATLSAYEDWQVSGDALANSIVLSGEAKVDTDGHTIKIGTNLANNADAKEGSLTKLGEGVLELSGNNTYTGTTTVSEGTLKLTQSAALGSGDVTVESGANLELAASDNFAKFDRNLSGSGALVKSGSTELTYTGTFGEGTLSVKEGTLAVDVAGGSYGGLTVADGATFKAVQDVSFATIAKSDGGTLTGADESVQISVASGEFAGTVDKVTLTKVDTGTLNLDGAEFANGGSLRVEAGTIKNVVLDDSETVSVETGIVENLTLAGGTLNLVGTENSDAVTLSDLNLTNGTIFIGTLFEGVSQATISGTFDGSNTSDIVLSFDDYNFQTKYEIFTFTDETKSEWEAAFGTLTDGKFSGGNLTIAGGVGTLFWGDTAKGQDANTLYFVDNRTATTYYWRGVEGGGTWWDKSWSDSESGASNLVAFENRMTAVFDADSVGTAESIRINISGSDVYASEVQVDVGAGKLVYFVDANEDASLNVSEKITVTSGRLFVGTFRSDFYNGAIEIGENGSLEFGNAYLLVRDIDIEFSGALSGTGTIVADDPNMILTLSGGRNAFTGTLDVDAGTVKLTDSSGTENFTIDIAGATFDEEGNVLTAGGTVIATGGQVVNNPGVLVNNQNWGAYSTSELNLTNVTGTGTLIINSQDTLADKKFFTLNIIDGDFSGKIQLNSLDLAIGSTPNFPNVKESSIVESATVVLNNAWLNFFTAEKTFANNIEVTDKGGAIRVYSSGTGVVKLTGDISGAGTLTIKDGGSLKLTGAVGKANAALGALTLNSGTLNISGESVNISNNVTLNGTAVTIDSNVVVGGSLTLNSGTLNISGENSSIDIAGNVVLQGTEVTINSSGIIRGNVTSGKRGTMTPVSLGGTLKIEGNWTLVGTGQGGRVTTLFDDAEINVGGEISFNDNEDLSVGAGATLSATSVKTSAWGFNASFGANSLLSAGTITLGKGKNDFKGSEDLTSKIEIGTEDGTGTLTLTGTGTVQVKDIVFANKENTSWSSDAYFMLNGGTTEFKVEGAGRTITLNGLIAEASDETTSIIKKTGAGMLALGAATKNKGAFVLAEGTVKYTSTNVISFENSTLTFEGGTLQAGEGTKLKIGATTKLSGNAKLRTSGTGSSIIFAEDYIYTGEEDSISLVGGGEVISIEGGTTLTVGSLIFDASNVSIGGNGTLALDGFVTANGSGGAVNSKYSIASDTEIFVKKNGELSFTSYNEATGLTSGKTLTKTGEGTVKFTEYLRNFLGNIDVQKGTLESDVPLSAFASLTVSGGTLNAEVNRTGTASLSLTNDGTITKAVNLSGTDADSLFKVSFGRGTIEGALSLTNSEITFDGTADTDRAQIIVEDQLTWGAGNKIVLSDELRKSISNSADLISFDSQSGLFDENGEVVDLSEVFTDDEKYGRRELSLNVSTNDDGTGALSVISTGALIWNDGVATWVQDIDDSADWTTDLDDKKFRKNDYVEFLDVGDVAVNDNIEINGTINTSGVVFNLREEGAAFTVTGTGTLMDAMDEDGNLLNNAGLTVLSGNITIDADIQNEMTSGLYVYGGSLTVKSKSGLGAGTVNIGSAQLGVEAKIVLGFEGEVSNVFNIGNASAVLENAQAITLTNAMTGGGSLTKLGTGMLDIRRDSNLDTLTVAAGTMVLSGDAETAVNVKNVVVHSELSVTNGGGNDGANAAFNSITLSGGKMSVDTGAYRAKDITSSGESSLSGTLYVAEASTIDVSAGTLAMSGGVSGTAKLTKAGVGNLSLAEGFAIGTAVEHTAGTITFTNGGSIAGAYTITENSSVNLVVTKGEATLGGGITGGEGTTLNVSGAGKVVASAGDVTLASLVLNKGNFAVGGAAAQTFDADVVTLADGSTLTFAGESTGTIGAIALTGTQNKISITGSDTVTVSNEDNVAVLQGKGTLEITGGGTLQISGENYDGDHSPSIVLSGNSTLDFSVGDGEDAVVSLAKISTGTDGGKIAKSGTGTLIIADKTVTDMTFDGTVELTAGTTVLYSKLSGATLNVGADSTLSFYGLFGKGVDAATKALASELAKEISGAGTIEVGGVLVADDLSNFTGTLAAGTAYEHPEISGGVIYARAALADFVDNGGKILVQNSGWLATDEEDVTLANVSLDGEGAFHGANGKVLTVSAVSATADSALTLSGTGTLGNISFDGEPSENNFIMVRKGGSWTLEGETVEKLSSIAVDGGKLTVAAETALGEATVGLSGEQAVLQFAASGTYSNEITLWAASQEISATGDEVEVTLSGKLSGDSGYDITLAAKEGAKLSVDDSALGLGALLSAETGSTVAVNANEDSTLGSTQLAGAGTVEFNVAAGKNLELDSTVFGEVTPSGTIGSIAVSGEGTAVFKEKFSVTVAEGGEGKLTVSGKATINGTDLSGFTLTGAGTTTTKGGKLAAINSAENVSLDSGTLSVAGDISGSSLSFTAGASLATTGDAVSVSKATISGDVTLDVDAGTATYDSTNTISSATSVTLDANSSEASGKLQAVYGGALTKKGAGTWTVTNYELGGALTVEAGKLIWQNAKLGTSAISIADGATLQVNGLDEGNTLTGEIGGQGTLEIKGADLTLNATAKEGSSWELLVAEDSTVTINKALPGDLSISGTDAVAKLAYGGKFSSKLDVRNGGTLETSMDVSIVGEGHKIDAGTVTVASGTLTQETSKVEWLGSSTLEIKTDATFKMDLSENAKVNSKLSGAGTFALESDSAVDVALGGNVADFGGTVKIGKNVTAILSGSLFDNAEDVTVAGALRVTSAKGGTLKSLSGNGKVVLAADGDDIRRAEFKVNDLDGFDGTTSVTSGALVIEASKLASLSLEIGGEKVADYRETDNGQGMLSGAFLKLTNSGAAAEISSVNSVLNDKAGVIFDGAFKSSNTLKGGLFVTDTKASLALAEGANVDGNLFIASESTVAMNVPGSTTSAPAVMANTATSGTTIDGDLTFNGRVNYTVGADTKKGTTLIDVLGKAVFRTNRTADKASLYLDLTNYQGSLEGLRLVSGYDADMAKTINDYLTVEDSNGTTYQIQVLANGTVAVFGGVGDYTAPEGLTGLYNLLANSGSTLGMELNSLGDAAAKTEMLIGLSPISFGSLLEMQSGFASLENDLLRERLEQRRYERTNEFDSTVSFKPFVNVVGSSREGDGNGTESSNYDISHTGIVGGFDFALSKTSMLGFTLGLDWAEADVRGGGKHEADMSRLGVYGMTLFENNYLGYGLSFGGTSLNTERRVDGKTLTGDTNGNDFNASITFGSGWTVGDKYKMDIAPYVGLDLGYARTDSFEEKGASDVALAVDSMERWSLRGKIGAAVSWKATARLRLAVDAAFSHEFLDSEADIDAAFASGELKGSKFSSKAYMMDENTFQIGPRLDYRINGTWSASAAYTYETDLDDTTTHSANIGVRARF